MANFFALIIVIATVYLIMNVISRKKKELEEKEIRQRDQFLQETQNLLKLETSSNIHTEPSQEVPGKTYRSFVSEHFTSQGYIISESAQQTGIDLLGLKEKELIMIRCDNRTKEIQKEDIKNFIADCTLHIEKNPIFSNRQLQRIYVISRPVNNPEILNFIHSNPQSIRLLTLRMTNQ